MAEDYEEPGLAEALYTYGQLVEKWRDRISKENHDLRGFYEKKTDKLINMFRELDDMNALLKSFTEDSPDLDTGRCRSRKSGGHYSPEPGDNLEDNEDRSTSMNADECSDTSKDGANQDDSDGDEDGDINDDDDDVDMDADIGNKEDDNDGNEGERSNDDAEIKGDNTHHSVDMAPPIGGMQQNNQHLLTNVLKHAQKIISFCVSYDNDDWNGSMPVINELGGILFDAFSKFSNSWIAESNGAFFPTSEEINFLRNYFIKMQDDEKLLENIQWNALQLSASVLSLLLPSSSNLSQEPPTLFVDVLQQMQTSVTSTVEEQLPPEMIPTIGNAANLNSNTKGFLRFKLGEGFPTVCGAISDLIFQKPNLSILIRLSVYDQMRNDKDFKDLCRKENLVPAHVRKRFLNCMLSPLPIELKYISTRISKNIHVHLSDYDDKPASIRFGNFDNEVSVNILECDLTFYALMPINRSSYQLQLTDGFVNGNELVTQLISVEQPRHTVGSLDYAMEVFSKNCEFCVNLNTQKCNHVFKDVHTTALKMVKNNFQEMHPLELDNVNPEMMKGEKQIINVTFSETFELSLKLLQSNNGSVYDAVSIAMVGNINQSYTLRRAVATDFKQEEQRYTNAMHKIGYSVEAIDECRKKIYSLECKGDEDNLIFLANVVHRNIVLIKKDSDKALCYTTFTYLNNVEKPTIFVYNESAGYHPLIPLNSLGEFITDNIDQKCFAFCSEFLTEMANPVCETPNISAEEPKSAHHSELRQSSLETSAMDESDSNSLRPENAFLDQETTATCNDMSLCLLFPSSSMQRASVVDINGVKSLSIVSGNNNVIIDPALRNDKALLALDCLGLHKYAVSTTKKEREETTLKNLYVKTVLNEVAKMMEQNDDCAYVRVFMQRTTFRSTWINMYKEIDPTHYIKNPHICDKKAEQLHKIQLKQSGRELTSDLLKIVGVHPDAVGIYDSYAKIIFEKDFEKRRPIQVLRGIREAIVKKTPTTPHRKCPQYNAEGVKQTVELEKLWGIEIETALTRNVQIDDDDNGFTGFHTQSNVPGPSKTASAITNRKSQAFIPGTEDLRNGLMTMGDLLKVGHDYCNMNAGVGRVNFMNAPLLENHTARRTLQHNVLPTEISPDEDVATIDGSSVNETDRHESSLLSRPDPLIKDVHNSEGFLENYADVIEEISGECNVEEVVDNQLIEGIHYYILNGRVIGVSNGDNNDANYAEEMQQNDSMLGEDTNLQESCTEEEDTRLSSDVGPMEDDVSIKSSISAESTSEHSFTHGDDDEGTQDEPESEDNLYDEETPQVSDEHNTVEEMISIARAIGISNEQLNYQPPKSFEFDIPAQKLSEIFKDKKFIQKKWGPVISELITETQQCCSFRADRGVNYDTRFFAKMEGRCICSMKFEIYIENPPIEGQALRCKVVSHGEFKLIQTKSTARQIRGAERDMTKNILAHVKPASLRLHNRQKLIKKPLRLLHLNTHQRSLAVLQKIRMEAKKMGTTKKEVFEDIKEFQISLSADAPNTAIKGLVQHLDMTDGAVKVHLFTNTSISLLRHFQSRGSVRLFADATGGCISPIHQKRLLYYLVLAQTEKNYVFPVGAMVAHHGKGADISDFIRQIKAGIHKQSPNYQKPLGRVITCDFSFAFLNGIIDAANTMTMTDYLTRSYEVIIGEKQFEKSRSVVFICTSHLIKSFSRLVNKHLPRNPANKRIAHHAIHSLARIQESSNIEEFLKTVKVICETFGTEFVDAEALEINKKILRATDPFLLDLIKLSEDDLTQLNEMELPQDESVRKSSPFHYIFAYIRSQLQQNQNMNGNSIKNPLYCPLILDLLQDYYIPYTPLFSAMMLKVTNAYPNGRISNALIESEFNKIKNNYFDGVAPLNVFVRGQDVYFSGTTTGLLESPSESSKFKLKLKTQKPKRPGITQNATHTISENRDMAEQGSQSGDNNDSDHPRDMGQESEENWRRKTKQQRTVYVRPIDSPPPTCSPNETSNINFEEKIKKTVDATLVNAGEFQPCVSENHGQRISHPINDSSEPTNHAVRGASQMIPNNGQSLKSNGNVENNTTQDGPKETSEARGRSDKQTKKGVDNERHGQQSSPETLSSEDDRNKQIREKQIEDFVHHYFSSLDNRQVVVYTENPNNNDEDDSFADIGELQDPLERSDVLERLAEIHVRVAHLDEMMKKPTHASKVSNCKTQKKKAPMIPPRVDSHVTKDQLRPLAVSSGSILYAKDLYQLCAVKTQIDTSHMDFLLKFYSRNVENNSYIVLPPSYAEKSSSTGWKIDDNAIQDVLSQVLDSEHPKLLFPLKYENKWLLLDISISEKKCIVYDAMPAPPYQALNRLCGEIKEEILFRLDVCTSEMVPWKMFTENSVVIEKSMTGVFVSQLIKAKLTNSSFNKPNSDNEKETRMQLVKELLSTTERGRTILRENANDLQKIITTLSTYLEE